ncbi:MAG: glycosyltransferase [Oligoflexia bacterium]|nr:glycosyltransferase [Oligoflexia bacterium]MBF0366057.1 glycosyltransferase [Oligoflexia bacterium]
MSSKNSMAPMISVIIPTHNRALTIKRAIDSVLIQRKHYPSLEILVVDDASSDETGELLASLMERCDCLTVLRVSSASPLGVSHARNLGIKKAQGEWLAFLDSDDEWQKRKLERLMLFVSEHPALRAFHSNEVWVRNGLRVNQMKKHQKYGGQIFDKCLSMCRISPSASLIHKEVFKTIGFFREDFIVCEDYDFWLRMALYFEVGYLDLPLIIKYGGHEDQLSRRFVAMDYWRIKSMVLLYKEHGERLSFVQKVLVREEIARKAEHLLLGYKKHNNLEKLREVELMLTELS